MRIIELTQGQVALIDDEDYGLVSQYKWHAAKLGYSYYAGSTIRPDGRSLYMHRLIMQAPDGVYIDHINGNGLDNRRTNIRMVTYSQNMVNRKIHKNNKSGYRGVYCHKKAKSWRVQTTINGRRVHIGIYNTPEEASAAYEEFMISVYGDYFQTRI